MTKFWIGNWRLAKWGKIIETLKMKKFNFCKYCKLENANLAPKIKLGKNENYFHNQHGKVYIWLYFGLEINVWPNEEKYRYTKNEKKFNFCEYFKFESANLATKINLDKNENYIRNQYGKVCIWLNFRLEINVWPNEEKS